MKIEIKDNGIIFSEVYTGIGIKTDTGIYYICQRDWGIEVLSNGKIIGRFPEVLKEEDE